MSRWHSIADWLDTRTGYRAALEYIAGERLPPGVNWWFTLGSVLLTLLVVQVVTGAVLAMYYVPTPAYAYDSVQFIATRLPFGRILRGLHGFGASFIVVAAVLHLLRTLAFGAYKAPREVTWWSGLALLLAILGFALTGYLLPWDQRAYWATVVTINITASAPIAGPFLAALMRGGSAVGALTLGRWFAMHVILLPVAMIALVALHLVLMRRHGIAGSPEPRPGPFRRFFPEHAAKDAVVAGAVFAALAGAAIVGHLPLAAIADPTDSTYTPRPEWYFLPMFQLLKYFPGPLEPVASTALPALVLLLLAALPFIDRRPERHPRKRPLVIAATGAGVIAVATLMVLGLRDDTATARPNAWSVRALAGRDIASSEQCARCHGTDAPGPPLTRARASRDDQWVVEHVADPEVIAAGLRPVPPDGLKRPEALAVVAYLRAVRTGAPAPRVGDVDRRAVDLFGTRCVGCHTIEGDGGRQGPDLTHAGSKANRDAAWYARWIADPVAVKPDANMPSFKEKLSDGDIRALAAWLAARR